MVETREKLEARLRAQELNLRDKEQELAGIESELTVAEQGQEHN